MEHKDLAYVESIERAGASRKGNPTYRVTARDGRSWLTATDATIGYAATNYLPRYPETARLVRLTLRRGRIVNMTDADD